MRDNDLLVLGGSEVLSLLHGKELDIIGAVQRAYEAHAQAASSLPHSIFLRFPDNARNRIIALPAYLGANFDMAGIKWISSFPANVEKNLDRAAAVMVLNSTRTGRPEALLEGAVISAKRTAASAALAAQHLYRRTQVPRLGIIGTGVINFEIVRFVRAVYPAIDSLLVFDINQSRAQQFADKCRSLDIAQVNIADDIDTVLRETQLISFATTALTPHVADLSPCAPGTTVLHISLRDLTVEAILANDNVVDDIDHVCRAQTSVHLAEEASGTRSFIRGTLGDVLLGNIPPKQDEEDVTVFSPFGLGILDLAVGKLVYDFGREQDKGTLIGSFLSNLWAEEATPHV